MTTDLHDQVRATFDEIVAHTPGIGPAPAFGRRAESEPEQQGSRLWLVSAASAVLIGVGGMLWITTARDRATVPVSTLSVAATTTASMDPDAVVPIPPTPTEQERAEDFVARSVVAQNRELRAQLGLSDADELPRTAAAPWAADPTPVSGEDWLGSTGGPTLYPVLDSSPLDIRAGGASLVYEGASIGSQTNAVIARVEDDGTMSELYTFVVGEGAAAHDDLGSAVDLSTPQVTEFAGLGYARWNANGVPVVVMAASPLTLLGDREFVVTIGTDDRGHPMLDFESLPPGFTELVAPRPLARQAATARLRFQGPDAERDVGAAWASLDNPLANINLTEATTITPTQVNGNDAWIVSGTATEHKSVVFSPDDITWLMVGWIGTEADLLTIAGEIEFIPADQVGVWMNRYDVTLPALASDPVPG